VINIQNRTILLDLVNFSSIKKLKLYVVGGTLRNHLLQTNIEDVDLTGKNAANLGIKFAQTSNFSYVPLDKTPGRATTRVILPSKIYFDFTDMQGNDIKTDLLKRDFTINAMGQELSEFLENRETIIDLCKAKQDLKNKIIRTTSKSVFKEDPLRMLRAFRLAATMQFSISKEVINDISLHKNNINLIAGERIWAELITFFKIQNIYELTNLMNETGLLSCLFPLNYEDWNKVSIQFRNLESLILNPIYYFPKYAPKIKNPELLKLSLLLKDIETSKTFKTLKNLKASNREIAYISKSIQFLHFLFKTLSCNTNDSSLYDICIEGGDQLVEGILIHACTLSMQDESKNIDTEKLIFYSKLMEFYFTRYLPIICEKALLNGNEIIRKFNITPSPDVGSILEIIQRAQVLGKIKTKIEAEALVAKILNFKIQN